eukprot:83061_1
MSTNTSLLTTADTNDICSLPGIAGPCRALIDRYYYNGDECKYFTYSGCDGNVNNFESLSLCQETCMGGDGSIRGYHIAGFIMIVLVLLIFCVIYALYMKANSNKLEPHQYHTYNVWTRALDKYKKKECLFVRNIATHIVQSDIKQLFTDYGPIVDFEWKQTTDHDDDKKATNICFVEFKSVDDAHRAMGELNGFDIEGHLLCIRPASEYKNNIKQETKQTVCAPKPETLQQTTKVEQKHNTNGTSKPHTKSDDEEGSLLNDVEIGHFRDISNIVKRETQTMDTMNIDFDVDLIIAKKKHFVEENPDTPATATVTEWTVNGDGTVGRSSGDSADSADTCSGDSDVNDYDWKKKKMNRKKDEHSYVAINVNTKDDDSSDTVSASESEKIDLMQKALSHKDRMKLWRQSVTESERASKAKIIDIKSPRQLEIISMNKKVETIANEIETDNDDDDAVSLVSVVKPKEKEPKEQEEDSDDDVLNVEKAKDDEEKEEVQMDANDESNPQMLSMEPVTSMEIALEVISAGKKKKGTSEGNDDIETEKKRRVDKQKKSKKNMARHKRQKSKKNAHRRKNSGSRSRSLRMRQQNSLSRHRSIIESAMNFAV